MYQQATEILPFAATLWKDVKFNDIRLQPLLFYVVCLFIFLFLALFFFMLVVFVAVFMVYVLSFVCSFIFKYRISFSFFVFTVFDVRACSEWQWRCCPRDSG